MSTLLGTKLIMLIDVKMTPNVDILTFISMMNTSLDSLKVKSLLIFSIFVFMSSLNFMLS